MTLFFRSGKCVFNKNTAGSVGDLEFFGAPQRRGYRIIGHPRFGSGYLSHVMSECGIKVGHERVGSHGSVNWMLAADDLNYPYGAKRAFERFAYSKTMLFVRNPVKALPSVILENRSVPSYSFRRTHIYRAFGLDLNSYPDPLTKAVASILFWYKLCELKQPLRVIKIDDPDSVGDLLRAAKADEAGISLALQAEPQNVAAKKWPKMERPRVTKGDFEGLPAEFQQAFMNFCDAYGYGEPAAQLPD